MSDSFGEEVERLHETANRLVSGAAGSQIVEIFAERSFREHLTLSYGRRGAHGGPTELYDHEELAGAAVRVLGETSSRFSSVDSLDPNDIAALQTGLSGSPGRRNDDAPGDSLDLPEDVSDAVSLQEKRHLLRAAAEAALSLMPSLAELDVSFRGMTRRICVWASDIQPKRAATANVGIRVYASNGRASTHAIGGAAGGVGQFFHQTPESIARLCIDRLQALENSVRKEEIRGELPVVLEGGWGGVWLHETAGHLLEADTDSPHDVDAIGTSIGSESVTIVDDGTLSGGRGSSAVDDEGTPAARTVLVENGVLKNLLTDRRSARASGLPRTANGRRQDYRFEPLPRMSNLILDPGTASASDLIEDVDFGLYVRMIGSGEIRPREDTFYFDVIEAYVIEAGRIGAAVCGLRLSGKPSEMLRQIVGVGDDFRLDPARGVCVKSGQTVPVSVGMPTVLLHGLTVSSR